MGQCTSRKATGNLTTSTFVSHIKPTKMEKHASIHGDNAGENRKNPISPNENSNLSGSKKPQTNKYSSKGVAMSFGFKRRPTPMTANNGTVLRDCENSGTSSANDPNGNKDGTVPVQPAPVKDRTTHKVASSQKPSSFTPRPSRFGFHPTTTDRTNKVYDIKTPSPIEFGSTVPNANSKSRLTSPTTEQDILNDKRTRTFTRNMSKTETTERRRIVTDNNENSTAIRDRLEGSQIQMGKFTFQTTRLPQPEPIRVIETKTAKTIANNNKRSARLLRQYEEASMKGETLTEDSGFSTNTSGYLGENDYSSHKKYLETSFDDNRLQQSFRSNASNLMENSDSFSDTCTPPPLPELPSVFLSNNPKSTNTEKEYGYKTKHDRKKTFVKLGTQRTFLKSRPSEDNSSPHSSSEHDWINAGEAMAEDSGLLVSPKHKIYDAPELTNERSVSTCATVVEAALQTLVKPAISLELTPNLQTTQKNFVLDEDPNFTAVVANSKTGHLLDEEILSPVESLLSSSETDDIVRKKLPHSSSDSKDINEKLTPPSPETPSNGTYSLSLSEDKDDFLIDDEIADQPQLVFEDTINNIDDFSSSRYKQKKTGSVIDDPVTNQRAKAYEIEASPLLSRKKLDLFRNMTASYDSLSPCESIASDDLMMEFDISLSNEVDNCDRFSGSFSSIEDTSKCRFKSDDTIVTNKTLFKGSPSKPSRIGTPNHVKNSPRLLRSRLTQQFSSENKSPKKNPLHQLGYHSMTYDPTSDCLTLTKANHSAIQQDIIGIKTMLLTLKRVLNESATQSPLNNDNDTQVCPYGNNSIQNNNNNNNEFKIELADLRRQVIFLQGQLEDKENIVSKLQKEIDHLVNHNTQAVVDTPLLSSDIQNRCNAATQTERIRPISGGSFTLSGSSVEDNSSLVSYSESTHGLSALHLAAFSGCPNSTNYLISRKVNVNTINKCYSPLHCAAIAGKANTAKILLDNGARVNSITNGPGYETPLFIAVGANAVECVELFIKRGAQIVQEGKLADMSPLFLAAELGHPECLRTILEANTVNSNSLKKSENGNTALHLAAEEGHAECIEVLLENGADPNLTNLRSQSPLHLAVKTNSYTSVVLLLKTGHANVNIEDFNKRTPLHEAVELTAESRRDIVKVLLGNGADVDAQDQHGFTPLHIAALNELPHCVGLLIGHGADFSIKSNTGLSAFALIAKKTPAALDAIKDKFSEYITLKHNSESLNEIEMSFDFRTGLHHPNEYALLNVFIDSGHTEMLLIPFCTAFLYVTWCRIRRCYYGMICNSLTFSLVLVVYVLTALAYDCDRQINDATLPNNTVYCKNKSYMLLLTCPVTIDIQWYLLVNITLILAYRKTYGIQGYPSLKDYFLNISNILEWHCILYVFLISFVYTGRVETWQVHTGGFAIMSAWTNVMFMVGQLPVFGPYVAMFQKVQSEFFKLLLVYCSLLFGYTISFCVFFPNSSAFANPLIGIISTLVMMTGDMNYNILLDYDKEQSTHTMGKIGAQIAYTWFVLFITIILMNLLVGIAVHDIQGLQKTADLSRLVRQTKVSSYIEQSHLNRSKISKSLMTLFRVVPKPYLGVLKCKPLDPAEDRLPKVILQAAYDLVRKRESEKTKVFSRTQSEKSPWKRLINGSLKHNYSELKSSPNLNQLAQKLNNNFNLIKSLRTDINELKESFKKCSPAAPTKK